MSLHPSTRGPTKTVYILSVIQLSSTSPQAPTFLITLVWWNAGFFHPTILSYSIVIVVAANSRFPFFEPAWNTSHLNRWPSAVTAASTPRPSVVSWVPDQPPNCKKISTEVRSSNTCTHFPRKSNKLFSSYVNTFLPPPFKSTLTSSWPVSPPAGLSLLPPETSPERRHRLHHLLASTQWTHTTYRRLSQRINQWIETRGSHRRVFGRWLKK